MFRVKLCETENERMFTGVRYFAVWMMLESTSVLQQTTSAMRTQDGACWMWSLILRLWRGECKNFQVHMMKKLLVTGNGLSRSGLLFLSFCFNWSAAISTLAKCKHKCRLRDNLENLYVSGLGNTSPQGCYPGQDEGDGRPVYPPGAPAQGGMRGCCFVFTVSCCTNLSLDIILQDQMSLHIQTAVVSGEVSD